MKKKAKKTGKSKDSTKYNIKITHLQIKQRQLRTGSNPPQFQ